MNSSKKEAETPLLFGKENEREFVWLVSTFGNGYKVTDILEALHTPQLEGLPLFSVLFHLQHSVFEVLSCLLSSLNSHQPIS